MPVNPQLEMHGMPIEEVNAMRDEARGPWVDCLWEKHECFDYTPREVSIKLNGRLVTLLVPSYVPDFEVLCHAQTRDLLFLILRLNVTEPYYELTMGVIVVARRLNNREDVYATTIWHELFTWALKYLGLEEIEETENRR